MQYVSSVYTVCSRIIVILFCFSDSSLRARTFVSNVKRGGHNSTVGVTLPEVWARSVQCVARGKPFKSFLALGTDRTNPLVSATSSIVRAYKGYSFLWYYTICART